MKRIKKSKEINHFVIYQIQLKCLPFSIYSHNLISNVIAINRHINLMT